jgi:hypothetical protein
MNDGSPLAPSTHDQCYPGPGVWVFLLECLAPLVVLWQKNAGESALLLVLDFGRNHVSRGQGSIVAFDGRDIEIESFDGVPLF